MAEQPTPTVEHIDDVTVVRLGPGFENLDESHLEAITPPILATADEADPPLLVIDLSHTDFFGSSFIEVLFRLANRIAKRDNGRFAISGLKPYCAEVLSITHLDELWPMYKTSDEAVTALKQ